VQISELFALASSAIQPGLPGYAKCSRAFQP
jgi:hypothetical protein